METKPDKAEEVSAAQSVSEAGGSLSPVHEGSDGEMPLSGHLQEFRSRLIICLVVVAAASGVSYNFVEEIIDIISAPAGKLYFLNPAEVFFVFWLIPTAVLLFYAGLAFSYYAVFPAAVLFFMGFATASLQPMFSLSSYLSFFIAFMLPFGVVFELPLVLFFLAKMGLITSAFLKSKRRVLIVVAFIFAAVVSPTTDIFTQVMIAVPMIVLYEASILLVRFILRK